jgi:hypothetical protein
VDSPASLSSMFRSRRSPQFADGIAYPIWHGAALA